MITLFVNQVYISHLRFSFSRIERSIKQIWLHLIILNPALIQHVHQHVSSFKLELFSSTCQVMSLISSLLTIRYTTLLLQVLLASPSKGCSWGYLFLIQKKNLIHKTLSYVNEIERERNNKSLGIQLKLSEVDTLLKVYAIQNMLIFL